MAEFTYVFGPFVFDMQRRLLLKQGSPVLLGQRALSLLETLLSAEGRAVSKADLFTKAWHNQLVEENNLAVQIAAVRRCLEDDGGGEHWIATVQRFGYQFVGPWHKHKTSIAPNVPTENASGPTIAVIPFTTKDRNEESLSLCNAISDDIVIELARWRGLVVRSLPVSNRPNVDEVNNQELAASLHVRYIVRGSIRIDGASFRISVQLIDCELDKILWAEVFEKQSTDKLNRRDDVTRRLVSTLAGRVRAASTDELKLQGLDRLGAYECVLKGNALHWDDPAEAAEARRLFERAVALDPTYGFAHAMLAVMHYRIWEHDLGTSDAALNEAYRLARLATELDPNESTSFAILSHACMFKREFDLALHYAQRATEINPGNQWTIADRGVVLMYAGHPKSALRCFNRAAEIDSYFDPPWFRFCNGQSHMMLGHYQRALTEFSHLSVRSWRTAAYMAGCSAQVGDFQGAQKLVQECLTLRPEFSIAATIAKRPFRNSRDAQHISTCLTRAGLPP